MRRQDCMRWGLLYDCAEAPSLIVHPSTHEVSSFSPALYLRSVYVDTNLLLHETHCERIAQAFTCNSPPQKEGI